MFYLNYEERSEIKWSPIYGGRANQVKKLAQFKIMQTLIRYELNIVEEYQIEVYVTWLPSEIQTICLIFFSDNSRQNTFFGRSKIMEISSACKYYDKTTNDEN